MNSNSRIETVFRLQPTGAIPTVIGRYNPQGQLVSRNSGDEVNQTGDDDTSWIDFITCDHVISMMDGTRPEMTCELLASLFQPCSKWQGVLFFYT